MLHQVGVGALGPVFRTYEPTRDRLVAVKAFRLDITPEQAAALADELAKSADAGLFHPSIVEPIAAGVEGSLAYRADEYVAAETLDVALRHYAPAPIEKVLPFVTQLAGAIDFARSAGFGHGALHPRDVFVTPDEVRASGFGVVEALERVGIRAPVRRPYTAPERVAGGTWDTTADVFSLGVIAYELLTGRRPSGMGDRIGTLTGGPNQAAIHAVLAKAVAEDPLRRYPSALAFASALDAASRGVAPAADALPAARAGAAAAPPLDEEAAAEAMPPPAGVDEREEPVEAEQEEDVFRASEPEFDDIAAERDDDEAHASLGLHEQAQEDARFAAAADQSLFEEEAVEDLALGALEDRQTERFADEFAAASEVEELQQYPHNGVRPGGSGPLPVSRAATRREVPGAPEPAATPPAAARPATIMADREPPRITVDEPRHYDDDPLVVPERRGLGIVPVALTVLLALLVGFAAGYAVRGPAPQPAAGAAAGDTPADGGRTAQAPAAQPFSEGAVTPPAAEPRPSGDAPPPASPPAADPPAADPPASEPPAPVATSGRVDVRSTPAGAGVTVDGRWRGRTPLTIEDLRFGRHVVRVVQPGYVTAREDVTLSSSSPSRALSFRLERTAPAPAPRTAARPPAPPPARPASYTGSIYVDSRPRGARVLVNGKLMGTTPLRIPDVAIGSQIVRLELENHRIWTTTTRVSAGQESRVTGSLEPIR